MNATNETGAALRGSECNAELGLYPERDHAAQGEHYMRYIDAMTLEGLHDKSRIAGELAARDIEIERLRAALAQSCDEHRSQIYDAGPGGGCALLADAVAAERERCAQIVEDVLGWEGTREVAARIRGA